MQVKKEQDTEPIANETSSQVTAAASITNEVVTASESSAELSASAMIAEEKLSSSVPEDVSLNTPVSKELAEDEPQPQEPEPAPASPQQPQELNLEPQQPQPQAEMEEAAPEVIKESEAEIAVAEKTGGDLEGSVTEEGPPQLDFDSDNEVEDEEISEAAASEPKSDFNADRTNDIVNGSEAAKEAEETEQQYKEAMMSQNSMDNIFN